MPIREISSRTTAVDDDYDDDDLNDDDLNDDEDGGFGGGGNDVADVRDLLELSDIDVGNRLSRFLPDAAGEVVRQSSTRQQRVL